MSQPTLIFATTTKLISRLIRWVTGSRVSHAAIGVVWEGVPVILEATQGGVVLTPRDRWLEHHIVVAEYGFKAGVLVDLPEAIQSVGRSYDYTGLVGYLVVLIGRRLGRRLRNPFATERGLVCSEFVLCLDKDGSISTWSGLDAEATTPEDLLKLCVEGKEFYDTRV